MRVAGPVGPLVSKGTATSVDVSVSFDTNMSVGVVGRHPVASGWKTWDKSVIRVGAAATVALGRLGDTRTDVAAGALVSLADGAVVGVVATGTEHAESVAASSATMKKRMPTRR